MRQDLRVRGVERTLVVRTLVVLAVATWVAAVVWAFVGAASSRLVDTIQVVGGLAGVAGLVLVIAQLWPRRAHPAGAVQAVADYLAQETGRSWRVQAKDSRLSTPAPTAVRWQWADEDVAVPPEELPVGPIAGANRRPASRGQGGWLRQLLGRTEGRVLTPGAVTQLREQLYEQLDADRTRIVVLGPAGSGKTAAMLLLLLDILDQRPATGSAEPVPVWLTLGSWDPTSTPLREWAATTMSRDYRGLAAAEYGGGTRMAAELIRAGRVALFLDGLDEMPPTVQGAALQAIDRDAGGLRVVLTSRPEQYQAAVAEGRLYGAAVIQMLPVDLEHAAEFLLADQLAPQRRRWKQLVDQLQHRPDSVAARTLTSPLTLSLARDTYTSTDPAELLDTQAYPTSEALLRHLLLGSLKHAYPDPTSREHATGWLSWIAHHMGTNRDLRWWDIPTWTELHRKLRLAFVLATGLAFVLAVGGALAAAGLVALPVGRATELAVGLWGGLWVGLTGGLAEQPRTMDVRWPNRREAASVLAFMLTTGLTFGLTGGLAFGLTVGLTGGLTVGLTFGFTSGLVETWSKPASSASSARPIEIYRSDRRRTLSLGLAVGLAFGLLAGLAVGLPFGPALGLAVGLAGGLLGALVGGLGLGSGVGPALQLTIVELLWRLRGQRVRFMPLLQEALDRQVLRQAGGVYQFRHATLQDLLAEHFPATAPPARDPAS
jgi:hypothetical protein